ncbi:hypothetical protein [Shimia aestuarii]|uniref:Glycosyltransferase, GT2 family n=1 Tax=Shimia aestuarii TaxID=254406 RepID=A0A1I4TS32_9RHOB|nr:hypothetical protein [Shimia aestuarii]SFM79632.1 Glycosyltransferase, GT2 family [Shimia aestuarii]
MTDTPPTYTTLQSLIWPEQGICTERDLYVRLHGAAGLSAEKGLVHFTKDSRAKFNTWFNLFNIGKWNHECELSDLRLSLEGTGQFEVSVFLAIPDRSWERLLNEVVTLSASAELLLDLSHVFDLPIDEGVIYFELKSLGSGKLAGAHWKTANTPRRVPNLMLSVTTFRREAAVQDTARRFEKWVETTGIRDHVRMTVVDNGQSVEIPESSHITVIPNENLGGAGGFARGLLAAKDTDASHCLFMDDDASIHMQSIERSYWFLAYAINPDTAIAGAMINTSHRWAIWENGATFNTRCVPLHMGTDLRDPGQSFGMEYATTGPAPENFYGGWWYFAFPLDTVEHMPFPFFVRGDDISFSLAHNFNIVVLNGVVSFQDSFTDKESPLTWYLDLRSHMAHHLSLETMDIGRVQTLKIALWFYLRNLPRMHYETIAAINLALEDVIKGPEFFDKTADMAQRRADIKALTVIEAWKPVTGDLPENKWRINSQSRWARLFMKITLNGHLLPLFRPFGNRVTIKARDRGLLKWVWGASQLTYLSSNRRQCYTVRHSKLHMAKVTGRFISLAARFLLRYPKLRIEWGKGYENLTSDSYWRDKLRT